MEELMLLIDEYKKKYPKQGEIKLTIYSDGSGAVINTITDEELYYFQDIRALQFKVGINDL